MPGEHKRLFFALWPDDETRKALAASTGAIVSASGGRAVLPRNLHITLAFLHNVETSLIPCIESAALRAAGGEFELSLSRLGYWYRSRILWLAPEPGNAGPVESLADSLWRELAQCGFTPERRRFRPHVTLARKATAPAAVPDLPPVHWRAQSFALVQSKTGQRQSEYAVIETFPLDSSGGNSR